MNIKQVAAKAKVSTATVSRTMNQSPLVSPQTAEKVWHAIRDLGFYPNTQARALVSGKSRIFGLIISDISNPFFPELVKSFEDAAVRHDYEVLVANTDYHSERMDLCVRRMIQRNVDGVAIMTSEMDRRLISDLSSRGFPIVFLDLGKLAPLVSNIAVDYAYGIKEAVQHLVQLGHRRFAFISGPTSLKSARTRYTAVLKHLRSCGINERQLKVIEGNHRIEGGEAAMQELLASSPRPTAVLCSNDLTAIGALGTIHAAGLRVPEDISIIGFDDIQISRYTQPALTTVRLSREDIGRQAFQALYNSASGGTGAEIRIRTNLVVRSSTGTAPGRTRATSNSR